MKNNPICCPDCGEPPIVNFQYRPDGKNYSCYHKCQEFYIELNSFFKTESEAVKKWNEIVKVWFDNQ